MPSLPRANPISPQQARVAAAARERPRLAICTAMAAKPGTRDGSFVLTRKFLDGVLEYVRHWPGSVTVWIERAVQADSNLDHVEVDARDLPFDLQWIHGRATDKERFDPPIESADLVLAALVDKHVCLAGACAARGVPLVYITEYSMKTRQQIVRAETNGSLLAPILRWRRQRWNVRLEDRYRSAVKSAAGVQCNGLPTYHAYRGLNERCLLYFDTRVRADQLVPRDALDARLTEMRRGNPLRLAFSGRLITMKGVDHLPLVARELMRLKVPFTLDICGGGALESQIKADIARFGLGDSGPASDLGRGRVRMRGVLDFQRELLPMISREVDLFVCCHPQGDPSCTYLETYSCGVPIVGYDNEAFAGLAPLANAGGRDWVTPLGDPITLARKIADLNGRRDEIAMASYNALALATQHTFEHTMRNRVQHMVECMKT